MLELDRLEALLAKVRAQRKELRRLLRKANVENALLLDRLAERDQEISALRQAVQIAPKVELDMVTDDYAEVWADDGSLSNFSSGQTVALVPVPVKEGA